MQDYFVHTDYYKLDDQDRSFIFNQIIEGNFEDAWYEYSLSNQTYYYYYNTVNNNKLALFTRQTYASTLLYILVHAVQKCRANS